MGLKNKKFLAKKLLEENKIDVLCRQETEVNSDLDCKELMTSGYSLELENNFIIMKTNETKVGLNILSNRLSVLNGLIPLSWLNVSLNTFKVNCKRLLLGT